MPSSSGDGSSDTWEVQTATKASSPAMLTTYKVHTLRYRDTADAEHIVPVLLAMLEVVVAVVVAVAVAAGLGELDPTPSDRPEYDRFVRDAAFVVAVGLAHPESCLEPGRSGFAASSW